MNRHHTLRGRTKKIDLLQLQISRHLGGVLLLHVESIGFYQSSYINGALEFLAYRGVWWRYGGVLLWVQTQD